MEENKNSALMPSLMSGIYLAFALIVYSLLMYLLDIDRESPIMYISYAILAGGLFWAVVSYRDKHMGGFIEYGKAFSSGFLTGLFASIITAIFTYIYVQYIDPGLVEEILAQAEEEMLADNPNMSDEQMDQALSITASLTSPVMISVWAFLGNVLFTVVLSLIIAIFAKRENKQMA